MVTSTAPESRRVPAPAALASAVARFTAPAAAARSAAARTSAAARSAAARISETRPSPCAPGWTLRATKPVGSSVVDPTIFSSLGARSASIAEASTSTAASPAASTSASAEAEATSAFRSTSVSSIAASVLPASTAVGSPAPSATPVAADVAAFAATTAWSWNRALQNFWCVPPSGIFHPQKYDSTPPCLNALACASRIVSSTLVSWHPSRESWCVARDHSDTAVCSMPFRSAASFISPTFALMKLKIPSLISSNGASHCHVPGAGCSHARYMCVSKTAQVARSSCEKLAPIHCAISYTFMPHVSMKLTSKRGVCSPASFAGSAMSVL